MRNLLALFLFGLAFACTAQVPFSFSAKYQSPQFEGDRPLWTHTVYDSTIVGVDLVGLDPAQGYKASGYNHVTPIRPPQWSPLLDGDHMYTYTTTLGTTRFIFGAIIEKIHIPTGKVIWTTSFDNRTLDRQEYVQFMEVGDTLKVITMKRKDDHHNDLVPFAYNKFGAPSYICERNYDTSTGQLLAYTCGNPEDDTTHIVAPHSEGVRILYRHGDDGYAYVRNNSFDYNVDRSVINAEGIRTDFAQDSFYLPDTYDRSKLSINQPSSRIWSLSADSLLMLHHFDYYVDGTWTNQKDLAYLSLYDENLDLQKRIPLDRVYEAYPDFRTLLIRRAYNDAVIIRVVVYGGYYELVLDFNGNIHASFGGENESFKHHYNTYKLEHSGKYMVVGMNLEKKNSHGKYRVLDFFLFENDQWDLKQSITMHDDHFVDFIHYLAETEDNDLIMAVNHHVYDRDVKAATFSSDLWMLLDGAPFDLSTTTKDLSAFSNVRVSMFPNPASEKLYLESDVYPLTVRIHDSVGRVIHKQDITNNTEYIDVRSLQNGTYFISASNQEKVYLFHDKLLIQK